MSEEDFKGLRRELDKELINVVKSIPQLETKIDNILTILTGDVGLCNRVEKLEKREIRYIGYTAGFTAAIILLLKIIKMI